MKKVLIIVVMIVISNCFAISSVSGFITNEDNGESIAYASIVLRDEEIGVYSNKDGYYVINNLKNGKYYIQISAIGYTPEQIELNVKAGIRYIDLNIALEKNPIELSPIEVKEKRLKFDVNNRQILVSNMIRTSDDINDLPQVADADIFRALQMLPGVTAISDFSSGLYIRGGSPDQNLILLDETDVYNPTHFGGVFSTFNTDAVENIELLKGGFPAKYGGRLSSVLNVNNRDGNRKYLEGTARVSMISTNVTVEGPWKIGKQKGSYMGSFRRTYLELLQKFFDLPKYYFYDGHAKVNWDLGAHDRLMMSSYFGKDRLKFDMGTKMLIDWGNQTYTAQWNHIFNPELYSKFILASSYFGSVLDLKSAADSGVKRTNDLYDFTFKGLMTYQPVPEHIIDFGIESKFNDVRFKISATSDMAESGLPDIKGVSNTTSFYIQESWDLEGLWTIQPGIRFTKHYSENRYLPGTPNADYFRISPRFSCRRIINDLSNLYFSYGRYYQYITAVTVDVSSFLDLYFPIDETVSPMQADYYILGYKTQIDKDVALEFELYYKDMKGLVEYRLETDYEWEHSMYLEDIFNKGDGYSYGADFLLRTDLWGWEGFFGYTFGITKRKLENVNIDPETDQEQEYYPRYDRTHQINLAETYKYSQITGNTIFKGDLSFSTTMVYGTGQPFYKPEWAYYDSGNWQLLNSYSDRIRLPEYLRIDLSFKLLYQVGESTTIEPYLQIINILNRDNVSSLYYVYDNEEHSLKSEKNSMFPFLPFLGFNLKF